MDLQESFILLHANKITILLRKWDFWWMCLGASIHLAHCDIFGGEQSWSVDNQQNTVAGSEGLLGLCGTSKGILRWLEDAERCQEKTDGLWLCWRAAASQLAEEEHHLTKRTPGTQYSNVEKCHSIVLCLKKFNNCVKWNVKNSTICASELIHCGGYFCCSQLAK